MLLKRAVFWMEISISFLATSEYTRWFTSNNEPDEIKNANANANANANHNTFGT
jgi:hypothetical protein